MRRGLMLAGAEAIQHSQAEMLSLRKARSFRSKSCKTPFGTLHLHTRITERQELEDGETRSETDTETSIIFHPAPWLLKLGLRYGLNAMSINHHKTWQYTIMPVHAVPNDSLIFDFCKDGNVEAIKRLFDRGEASVYDTDTNGWTPLFVSATDQPFVEP
ncbi:hypothetical protein BJY04DRAFT_11107 [Aspergillus karnatakaensis]|uniref:ankyrin repeat domain-containing protein n=1 Tax=Aspergillus karnatakaensis TaxID=1810916 RepID=UPI003CCE26AC